MNKETATDYQELAADKFKKTWADLGEDLQWSKAATELRLQMEFLEAKQNRLFKDYGKAAYLSGSMSFNGSQSLTTQIQAIEQELQKKYAALQKLKYTYK